MLYASDLLYITATFSARTAVLCLIHALSPEYWHTLFTKYCIALSMLVSVTGVSMIAFGCNVEAPWSQTVNECGSIVSLFSSDAMVTYMSLTAWLSVQTLDRYHRVWHCLGTGNLRRHSTNALQPAKAMEWQIQSHNGLCVTVAVCRVVLQAALF
jgi:hypothetical protein